MSGSAQRVRIGVIGAGSISQQVHLPYLAELRDRFEVVGVCDASPTLAAAAAEPFAARAVNDYRELLALAPDAILVAVNGPAEDLTVDALEAGCHVLVEKPMAWSPREADRVERAVQRTRGVLLVGYMKRYDPGYLLAERLLGEIGEVRGGIVRCVAGPNQRYIDDVAQVLRADDVPAALADERDALIARRTEEVLGEDVGPDLRLAYLLVLGITCHELSVLRGLLGAPVEVSAAQVWDGGRWYSATLRYPTCSIAYMLGRVATRRFDEQVELWSEHDGLALSFPSPFLKHAPTVVTRRRDVDGRSVQERSVASYQEAFRRELEHFHACIVDGAAPRTPAAEGRADAELMAALVRAARDGTPQPLPPKRASAT